MSPLSSFAQHAVDLLASVGEVRARAMFGGYGLSLNGVTIGLIAEDRIYLRTDEVTRAEFARAGSGPFIYPSKNGPMTMKSYWALPEDSVDDAERAARWGRLAVEAAHRTEAAKSKPRARAAAPAKTPAKKSPKPSKKMAAAPKAKPQPRAKPKAGAKRKAAARAKAR